MLTIKFKTPGREGRKIYYVNGSETELAAYRENQGEYLVEDDETGKPLWITRGPFQPSGTVIRWNDEQQRYRTVVTEQSMMMQEALLQVATRMLGMSSSAVTPTESAETPVEDADFEEPAAPAPAPARRTTTRRAIK